MLPRIKQTDITPRRHVQSARPPRRVRRVESAPDPLVREPSAVTHCSLSIGCARGQKKWLWGASFVGCPGTVFGAPWADLGRSSGLEKKERSRNDATTTSRHERHDDLASARARWQERYDDDDDDEDDDDDDDDDAAHRCQSCAPRPILPLPSSSPPHHRSW